jgi:hypothetical protein
LFVRRLAATALIVALSLTTSACSISGNVASLQPYSPSDGQQVDLEQVMARNFMYLVADSGNGYLVGSLVSQATEDRVIKIQYVDPNTQAKTDYFVEIPAGQKVDFGYNGNPAILLPVVERPGQTAKFYFLESDTINASMRVPVLDGTLQEYRLLLEILESESQAVVEEEAVS